MLMKTKPGLAVRSLLLVVVATAVWGAPFAVAGDGTSRIAPPVSHAYGKTLAEWQTAYWRWFLGSDQDPDQSMVGNVKLMPNPDQDVSGAGTPEDPVLVIGELAITLRPGTPFVLPLIAFIGERYNDGTPDDDPAMYAGRLGDVSLNLTIDGRTVVSDANKAAFHVPTVTFDPIVIYPEPTDYGAVAAIWFHGVAIVSPPLSVGQHVIRLDGTDVVPGVFSVIFRNTWYVTVSPR
jgi:hypothetical protein